MLRCLRLFRQMPLMPMSFTRRRQMLAIRYSCHYYLLPADYASLLRAVTPCWLSYAMFSALRLRLLPMMMLLYIF